jgi:hypothetical protein
MSSIYRLVILVLLACGASLGAPSAVTAGFTFAAGLQAGQSVTVTGIGLDAVVAVALQSATKQSIPVLNLTKTSTALTFTIPLSVTAGIYTVALSPGGTIPAALTVAASPAPAPPPAAAPAVAAPAPASPPPAIESVFPAAPIPGDTGFDFEINGSNFNPWPGQNIVNVDGQGDIPFRHNEAPRGCDGYRKNPDELPCLETSNDGRRLSVFGFQRRYAYQGPIKVRVFVNNVPSGFTSFTLSRVNHRIIVWLTFVVFAVLMYIVYRLVASGIKPYIIAGQKYSRLAAFVLDKETNSYSLSKFQALAFSLVFFFAYIYLFLCRALVQWKFDLPDVPDNYPTLLAISAGTTAAAIGLGSVRGTKGAGPVQPSAADFVSNGGMVAADRFQFFVWTLIACIGFIALILMQDPATINTFPTFPQGLLYVMGVSAAGYLGGKAARNPGPVLKQVKVAANGDDLHVDLIGTNLDKMAKFRIEGAEQDPAGGVDGASQAGAQQGYCTTLSFDLERASGFANGDHTFEIVNADGLGAQLPFTGNPMDIAKPAVLTAGTGAVDVTLTIQNYRDKSVARWQAPGSATTQDLQKLPQFSPPDQVTVSLVPGSQKGIGTLTFVTPGGATETTPLEVQ